MKILITGARGQVGSQLIDIINRGKSELGDISQRIKESEIIGFGSKDLNIADSKSVNETLNKIKPDIVINAAAYTNVNGAESNEEAAFKVNALGARNLAIACEKIESKLVHISTDYVFSGEGSIPFREYDLTNPQSVYGKTKNMGDNYVRELCGRYFIVRPSWVYGYNGKNFVYTIMKTAKEKENIKVVMDQVGTPTNTEDLCHHILKIMLTEEYGIYNCAGKGECSWYDFARKIVEFSKIDCKVKPCTTEEYPTPVKRPAYSSLDNMMLRCTIGDEMRSWEEALKVFIDNVKDRSNF
ncbi:dTDP-4-dehydrorhamnose reductase [Clostridium sp. 19966]|uniref:dTDP-4-dehydrorhamnose reductase n=1 Tax=Clostridium sp. 19966 TaxID=2768166 RepID=UPI0028E08985|nr:dTDP-4-dehydrorhamnose reductase [Clostridium sp. 19966]MDT8719157.1 dTDP-4-dehydrorhamnose reductase [Clostridium sp. 19966]